MDDPLADIIKAEPHDEDDEELGDLLIDDIDDEILRQRELHAKQMEQNIIEQKTKGFNIRPRFS